VKKCSYCGRENSDEAVRCRECGTELAVPSVAATPARPRDDTWLAWLAYRLRVPGTIVIIGLLYLLSFGPVERYCCARTITPPPLTALASSGSVSAPSMAYTIRYPAWVRVIYYPAFLMLSGDGGNGLYGRYLQWWENVPAKEPRQDATSG